MGRGYKRNKPAVTFARLEFFFTFVKTNGMAFTKTHKKVVGRPRKAVAKKAKPQKGSLEAIEESVRIMRKYNIDLSYLKP
jgi:hypothetical protein